MDIRSPNQSSWFPLMTGRLPQDRPVTVQMLSAPTLDGLHSTPGVELLDTPPQKILLHNHSQMQLHQVSLTHQALHQKPLTTDRLQALLQMQRMDSFCKCISKCVSNGKASKHKADLFLHVKGSLYKHVMDSKQNFLVLVIPKAWKYAVLVEAHDKFCHQGATHTYCLVRCQYYWKGMNKDIRK